MRTVNVSKKRVLRAALALAAIVGLVAVGVDVAGSLGAAGAEEKVETAAARAIGEALSFDHEEGQEAWAERVRPLCTEAGWSFWNLVGLEAWPQVVAQQYAVQSIELLDARVTEESDDSGQATVSVQWRIEYVQAGQVESEEKVYPVPMVEQDGEWLMDIDDESWGGAQ